MRRRAQPAASASRRRAARRGSSCSDDRHQHRGTSFGRVGRRDTVTHRAGDVERIIAPVSIRPVSRDPRRAVHRRSRDLTEPRLRPRRQLRSCTSVVARRGSRSAARSAAARRRPDRRLGTSPALRTGAGLGWRLLVLAPDGDARRVRRVSTATCGASRSPAARPTAHRPRAGRGVAQAPCRRAGWPRTSVYVVDQAEVRVVDLAAGGSTAGSTTARADFVHRPDVVARRRRSAVAGVERARHAVGPHAVERGRARPTATPAATVVAAARGAAAAVLPDGSAALRPRRQRVAERVASGERPLVDEPFEHAGPTWGRVSARTPWSPDGQRIAFTRNEAGFGRLCVVDVGLGAGARGRSRRARAAVVAGRSARGAAHRARAPRPRSSCTTRATWRAHRRGRRPDGDLGRRRPRRARARRGPHRRRRRCTPGCTGPIPRPGRHAHRAGCTAGRPTSGRSRSCRASPSGGRAGWHVLVPDHRGSTGHGRDYQQALRGRWGELDVADTVAVVDGRTRQRPGRAVHAPW